MADGAQRVTRRADVSRPFRLAQAVEDPSVLKLEVLTVSGSTRLVRQPGEGTYTVSVPATAGGETVELVLGIAKPGGAEQAKDADIARGGRPVTQAIEHQRYLDDHKLTSYLQALVKGLLEAKPDDPYVWMAAQLQTRKPDAPPPPSAVKATTAASRELPVAPVRIAEERRAPPANGGACVVTGPSGVGKSTLIKKLMAEFPGKFGFSVSHTTREPRPGEADGVDYHFVSRERMEQDIKAGLFIEHAEVHGNYYGTSIASVESVMNQGKVCLLDIDVQGAASVRRSKLASKTSFVFFAPPNVEVLEQRLRGRGTETEERVQKRLAGSIKEMGIYDADPDAWNLTLRWFNEDVEKAYGEFRTFLRKQMPSSQVAPRAVCAEVRGHLAWNTSVLGPSFYNMGIAPRVMVI